jgi:hypothetical protein
MQFLGDAQKNYIIAFEKKKNFKKQKLFLNFFIFEDCCCFFPLTKQFTKFQIKLVINFFVLEHMKLIIPN